MCVTPDEAPQLTGSQALKLFPRAVIAVVRSVVPQRSFSVRPSQTAT